MTNKLYQYQGLIHVHSTYSDGQRPIPEIAAIANELDVDFLLMSDHNTLQPKRDGLEGWYNNVLVGIGSELNDKEDKNHYLAFNIEQEIDRGNSAEEYVCRVRELGGFGIIAHPNESRDHIAAYPPYPWTIWESECFDGIEIWNQMSEWMEGLTHSNKFWRTLHPRRSIRSPKRETLAIWDKLNLKRKVVGIGGVDAHGHVHRMMGFFSVRIFRYKVSFRTIRTHVLVPHPLNKKDARSSLNEIYTAIQNGNCYISHRLIGEASDFRFWAESVEQSAQMGETLSVAEEGRFFVINPQNAESTLIYNGREIDRQNGKEIKFSIQGPGVYRVESKKKGKAWIFSNHIRIV